MSIIKGERQQNSYAVAPLERVNPNNTYNNNEQRETEKKDGMHVTQLRHAAMETYHALVQYGSLFDLSAYEDDIEDAVKDKDESATKNAGTNDIFVSEVRRSRLVKMGRSLWMTIRSNPELFNDLISENCASSGVGDSLWRGGDDFPSFEAKKCQAIASGYVRAIAARLIFLDYIDTRCHIGCPPKLHGRSSPHSAHGRGIPSAEELVFGFKIFSRAGTAILTHGREKDARASHDTLSLAVCCFDAIQDMAKKGNGQAAQELKGLLDEAFDAYSMLTNAASLFGYMATTQCSLPRDDFNSSLFSSSVEQNVVEKWPSLVLAHLKQAENFLKENCNVSFANNYIDDHDDGRDIPQNISKLIALQRYLPSLARLASKHGSHFAKLGAKKGDSQFYDHANGALHVALKTTDCCLREIRQALEDESHQRDKKKGMNLQVLHNLEAELIVVSIEAFYLLSFVYQSTGKKEQAIVCLDQIEKYMQEQQHMDERLFSNVMNALCEGKEFIFSETGASAIEGKMQYFITCFYVCTNSHVLLLTIFASCNITNSKAPRNRTNLTSNFVLKGPTHLQRNATQKRRQR